MTQKTFILLILQWFFASAAYGFGLDIQLQNVEDMETSLTYKAIKYGRIRYCIDIAPSAAQLVSEKNLSLEIESALHVWSEALEKLHAAKVEISHVSCDDVLDLRVYLGPMPSETTEHGAETQFITYTPGSPENYVAVRIDTNFVWHDTRDVTGRDNLDYSWHSMAEFVDSSKGETLESLLSTISFIHPMTVSELATNRNLPFYGLFWTTYAALLHEFGHAFGLCDTTDELFDYECDKNYRSNDSPQPPSIMRDANAYFLADDDIKGLQALTIRLKNESPNIGNWR